MAKKVEIKKGDRHGRLVILNELPTINYRRKVLCQCDCGNIKDFFLQDILHGNTKSCGCLSKELFIKRHNPYPKEIRNSRLLRIWYSMKERCYNHNSNAYRKYGAKGVIVCDEWKHNFMSFYNWAMSHGYSDALTIDRINCNGIYEPSNCRWATLIEQSNNRSNIVKYDHNGESHTITEWSAITGINFKCLYARIYNGWSIEKALTTKIRK